VFANHVYNLFNEWKCLNGDHLINFIS